MKIDTEGEVLSDVRHTNGTEKNRCSTIGCEAAEKDGEKEEEGRISLPEFLVRGGQEENLGHPGGCTDSVCEYFNWRLKAMDKQLRKQQKAFSFFKGRAVSGDKFYVSDGAQGTFSLAKARCAQAGGIMASPTNPEENTAIQSITIQHGSPAYLGINELFTKGIYRYPNGERISYSNWRANEPNNHQGKPENCVEMHETGQWNDIVCDANLFIICEF